MPVVEKEFVHMFVKTLGFSFIHTAEMRQWCEVKSLPLDSYEANSLKWDRSGSIANITRWMLLTLSEEDETGLFWETVQEVVRENGRVTEDLQRLLGSVGKKWEDNRIVGTAPVMLDPVKEMDGLETLHKRVGMPDDFVREMRSAYDLYSAKGDPKSALDTYRTVLEKVLVHIAAYAVKHYSGQTGLKVNLKSPASVRQFLEDVEFLHEKELNMVTAFYGWVSDSGTHEWSWNVSPSSVSFVMVVLPAWIRSFSERFEGYTKKYP